MSRATCSLGTVLIYAGALKLVGTGMRGAARGPLTGAATGRACAQDPGRRTPRRPGRAGRSPGAGRSGHDAARPLPAPPPLKVRRAHADEPPVTRAGEGRTRRPPAGPRAAPGPARPRLGSCQAQRRAAAARPGARTPGVPDGACPGRRAIPTGSAPRSPTRCGPAPAIPATPTRCRPHPGPQPASPVSAAIARAAARPHRRRGRGLRPEPPVLRREPSLWRRSELDDPIWEPDPEADFTPRNRTISTCPRPPRSTARPPVPEPKKVVQHGTRKVAKSTRAKAEAQPTLNFGDHAGGLRAAAARPADRSGRGRAPSPVRRGAGRKRPDARNRARRLRREGRDRLGPPRPGRHHVRARARAGPQGQPGDRPGRRHRAVDVGAVGARLHRARPQRDRDRTAQRPPRKGGAARDPLGARFRRYRHAPAAGARQGYRRRPDRRQPRQDAPPLDRGHHRLGQVGGDQHDDPEPALPTAPPRNAGSS